MDGGHRSKHSSGSHSHPNSPVQPQLRPFSRAPKAIPRLPPHLSPSWTPYFQSRLLPSKGTGKGSQKNKCLERPEQGRRRCRKRQGPVKPCSVPATLRPRPACLGADEVQATGAGGDSDLSCVHTSRGSQVKPTTPRSAEEETESRQPAQGCPVTLGSDQDAGGRLLVPRSLCPP